MTHKHHIIPKHEWKERFGTLDGVNDPDNIVYLTTEQHAQCHKLLYEQNGNKKDLLAFMGLSEKIGKDNIFHELCRLGGSKSGTKKIGIPRPDFVKKKLSLANKGNNSRSQHWIIITPNGNKISIYNLKKFCIENNLDNRLMHRTWKLKIKHKGYCCMKSS